MKTIQQNPTVVQTPWEMKSAENGGETSRECFLFTAILKDQKPMLYMTNVHMSYSENEKENEIVQGRLEDLLYDIKQYDIN